MVESLVIAGVTGAISSFATIAAIKVDIGWMKLIISELKEEIDSLKKRVVELEKGSHHV